MMKIIAEFCWFVRSFKHDDIVESCILISDKHANIINYYFQSLDIGLNSFHVVKF